MKPVSDFDRPQPRMEVTAKDSSYDDNKRQAIQNFSSVVRNVFTQIGPKPASLQQQNILHEFRNSLTTNPIHEYPDNKGNPVISMVCRINVPNTESGTMPVVVTFEKEGKATYQMHIRGLGEKGNDHYVQEPISIKKPEIMTATAQRISTQFDVEYQKTLTPASEPIYNATHNKIDTLDNDDFVIVADAVGQKILKGEDPDDDIVMVSPIILAPVEDLSVAMCSGKAGMVTKYMEWLKNNDELKPEQIIDLLKMDVPGTQADLLKAVKQGDAAIARAYFNGVAELHSAGKISTEQVVHIIFGNNYSGAKAFIECMGQSGPGENLTQNATQEFHNQVALELSRYIRNSDSSVTESTKSLMRDLSTITKDINAEGKKWLNTLILGITTGAYNKDNDSQNVPARGAERKGAFQTTLEWQSHLAKSGLVNSGVLIQTVKDIMHNSLKSTEGKAINSSERIASVLMTMVTLYQNGTISKSDLMSLFQTTKTSAGDEFVLANYGDTNVIELYFNFLKDLANTKIFSNENINFLLRNLDEKGTPQGPGLLHTLNKCSPETRNAFIKGLAGLTPAYLHTTQLSQLLEAKDRQDIRGVTKALTDNNPQYIKDIFEQLPSLARDAKLTRQNIENIACGPGTNSTLLSNTMGVVNEASREYISGLCMLQKEGLISSENLAKRLQAFSNIAKQDVPLHETVNKRLINLMLDVIPPPSEKTRDSIIKNVKKLFYFAAHTLDKTWPPVIMEKIVVGLKHLNQSQTAGYLSYLLQDLLNHHDNLTDARMVHYGNITEQLLIMVDSGQLTAQDLEQIMNNKKEKPVSIFGSTMEKYSTPESREDDFSNEFISILDNLHSMANKNYISNETLFKELLGTPPLKGTNLEKAADMNSDQAVTRFFQNINTLASARKLTNDQILQFVTPNGSTGRHLLLEIFADSDEKTQAAYLDGLYTLTKDKNLLRIQLSHILQSTDHRGNNALAYAMLNNKSETIRNYVSRLKEPGFTHQQIMSLLRMNILMSNRECIAQAESKGAHISQYKTWQSYCQSIEANARDLQLTPAEVRELTDARPA